jgi:TatD DNase family protein
MDPDHSLTRLVDTHCHLLLSAFDEDRMAVLARAKAALSGLVVVGDDVASSRAGVAITDNWVYATVGIHPHKAGEVDAASLDTLRELAATPKVVAIGEIGLDYHYEFAPRVLQQEALRAQLALAIETGLPVVVHCREAEKDLTAILDPLHRDLVGGVMHCFSGSVAFAERCLAWGFFLSFAGNVTFPKAAPLREAAQYAPSDRLLVETDSPYLAPQPVRGKRCEPIHVEFTARLLADLRRTEFDEFARQTTANAFRFLSLRSQNSGVRS